MICDILMSTCEAWMGIHKQMEHMVMQLTMMGCYTITSHKTTFFKFSVLKKPNDVYIDVSN